MNDHSKSSFIKRHPYLLTVTALVLCGVSVAAFVILQGLHFYNDAEAASLLRRYEKAPNQEVVDELYRCLAYGQTSPDMRTRLAEVLLHPTLETLDRYPVGNRAYGVVHVARPCTVAEPDEGGLVHVELTYARSASEQMRSSTELALWPGPYRMPIMRNTWGDVALGRRDSPGIVQGDQTVEVAFEAFMYRRELVLTKEGFPYIARPRFRYCRQRSPLKRVFERDYALSCSVRFVPVEQAVVVKQVSDAATDKDMSVLDWEVMGYMMGLMPRSPSTRGSVTWDGFPAGLSHHVVLVDSFGNRHRLRDVVWDGVSLQTCPWPSEGFGLPESVYRLVDRLNASRADKIDHIKGTLHLTPMNHPVANHPRVEKAWGGSVELPCKLYVDPERRPKSSSRTTEQGEP